MVKKESGCRVKGVGCRIKPFSIARIFFTIAYTLYPIPCLFGYTSLGYNYSGDIIYGYSARSVGMGCSSIAIADDSSAIFTNPACLTNIVAKYFQLSVSNAAVLFSDRWAPGSIKNNPSYYQFNEVSIAAKLPLGFAVGYGFSPLLNYSFDYADNFYDRTELIYQERTDGAGNLWSHQLGLAWQATDRFTVGFAYTILNGERERKYYDKFFIYPYTKKENQTLDGDSQIYGFLYRYNQMKFGGYYKSKAPVDYKLTTTEDYTGYGGEIYSDTASGTDNLPESFGLGFSCRFKGKMSPLFTIETNHTNWHGVWSGYSNTNDIRLGFEHFLNEWFALRYGFYTYNFYYKWDRYERNWYYGTWDIQEIDPRFYFFTFGSGVKFPLVEADIGYEFGKRAYSTKATTSSSEVRTDEIFQRIMLTARYRW